MMSLGAGSAQANVDPGLVNVLADWISNSTKGRVQSSTAASYVREAYIAAEKWRLDPLHLLAIMKAESNYQAKIGNKYGARGLMQVVPRYHKVRLAGRSPLNYKTNIDVGSSILNEYLEINKENYHTAMQKYSGGAGKAYKAKIRLTYKELRDITYEWSMTNDQPLIAEHRLVDPRRYTESLIAYQEEVNNKERVLALMFNFKTSKAVRVAYMAAL